MPILSTPHILAIDKPYGVAVQGGSGIKDSIDSMYSDCKLVHRLDRDTTGVFVMAKTKKAAARMTASFKDHDAQKIYLAITSAIPSAPQGLIEAPLKKIKDKSIVAPDGLFSETYYKTLATSDKTGCALVRFEPLSGRTHQIRVHAEHMGFPLFGDPRYGDFKRSRELSTGAKMNRLYLHAWRLDIAHPTEKGRLELSAPLPDDWPFEALDLVPPSSVL